MYIYSILSHTYNFYIVYGLCRPVSEFYVWVTSQEIILQVLHNDYLLCFSPML
jgi:hypothetical protein